jgi:hypothetical protein
MVDERCDVPAGLLDGHCLVHSEPGEVCEWSELWCYQLIVAFGLEYFLDLVADGHDYLPCSGGKPCS